MPNQQAIVDFQKAREHYLARRFAEARATMQSYRQSIDYTQFEQTDCRNTPAPQISVVIVSYQTNQALLECLDSVFNQEGPSFEVILVDNGGNESIHTKLAKLPVLWIKLPINLLPSEGRNIGAHFARGDLLVFLDDDALMTKDYLARAFKTMQETTRIGLRGRIQSKSSSSSVPGHYDLGASPKPAEFNLEGNMLIRTEIFKNVGGFDPLMFGHEGKELTQRCNRRHPNRVIEYRPELSIQHDFAETDRLEAKRERQAIGQAYLNYLQRDSMSAGISILVRAGDDLAAANDFIVSLVKHNSYKPIEVLLWAKDSQQALAISRSHIAQLFVRVLTTSTNTLGRIGQQARYDNLLIVDLPTQITSDVLPGWVQQQQTNLNTALLYSKPQLATQGDTALNAKLAQLANQLGKPLPKAAPKPVSQAKQPSPSIQPKAEPAVPNKPQAKPLPKPKFTHKINQTEAQIQKIESQIAQADADIAKLENQYLTLPENTSEKQALKDQLEDKVLTSCRLLINLKDAQDNLQELRILSICGV